MKTKTFTFLVVFLLSFATLFAQEREVNQNGNYKGVIRIKVNDELVKQFEELHQQKAHTINKIGAEAKGCVKTGIPNLDEVNSKYSANEYKRVFRYAGKFEKRHRAYGLHKWYEITVDTKAEIKRVIKDYGALKQVEIAEAVPKMTLFDHDPHKKKSAKSLSQTPTDSRYDEQWHYNNTGQTNGTADADIDLPEAWEIETGNSEVIVAIEDQGVDFDHEDLAGNMWTNPGETRGNGIDDDNNGYVDDYYGYNFGDDQGEITPGDHGSHTGGTVAAETNNGTGVAGIAGGSGSGDGVRLMSVEVFGTSGQGGFAEGFTYAADMGAHISQNSWGGGGESQSINDAIDYFIANGGSPNSPMEGGVVVIAAGNSDESSGASTWPAQYESAIAVAATNHNDVRSYYSNYGSWVDISAPGGETNSSTQEGVLSSVDGSYSFMQGTSMACPHVSGVAALIVSKFAGNITPSEVRSRLIDYADPIDDLNPNYTGQLGSGRLNAYNSLTGEAPEPPSATYCTSKGSDASYEWIANVEIGTFANSSDGAGYTDFTGQTVEVNAGQSYDITLTPGFASDAYDEYWKIWIDYNNDTTFTSDELAYDAGSLSNSAVTGTISIPSDISGVRRMRVSMKYNGEQTSCETFDYGEVEDYHVNISSGGGSDTEAPTAPANLSASNVTENSADLGWDASTDNVGVDHYTIYQDGSSVATTSNTSYSVTGLSASTTYTFTVKAEDAAGNVSSASNAVDVTTENATVSYCSSKGEDASYEWIAEVQVGSFSNTSGSAGYSDFTSQTINLTAGSDHAVTLTPEFQSSSYNEFWKIWIDYNGDKDFEDAGELVFDAGSLSSSAVSGNISVPSDASGTTRMRVSMKYNGEQTPCESFGYGEVEDYTVTFGTATVPTTPTGLTSSNVTTSGFTMSWDAVSNASSYNAQVREQGTTTWNDYTAITSTSKEITGLSAETTYEYRVQAVNTAGSSDYTTIQTVTTNAASISYCSSNGQNVNYEWIDLVELGSISNSTSSDGGYADYTNLSTNLTTGSNVTIYFSAGFASSSYTEYWHVWIDFDQNGTFDSDEEVVSGSSSSADKLEASFDVPTDASLGQTRMRVTMKYNSEASPCESFSYGEVEDYTVNITETSNYFYNNQNDGIRLEDSDTKSGLKVYPNPAGNYVHVEILSGSRNSMVSIYNTDGRLIKTVPIESNQKTIEISDIPAGNYIIKVDDEREPMKTQFIKK